MKKKGSVSEYRIERDKDLYDAFRNIITHTPIIRLPQIARMTVMSQAPRFYVSEERAAAVLAAMERGCSISHMMPKRQEMYREIHRRYHHLHMKHPHMPYREIIAKILSQPAPQFYLTTSSAIVILHHIRHRLKTKPHPPHPAH